MKRAAGNNETIGALEIPQPTEHAEQGNQRWIFLRSWQPPLPSNEVQELAERIFNLRSECRMILEEDILPCLEGGAEMLIDRIEKSREENSALEKSVQLDAQTVPDQEKYKIGFILYQLKNRSHLLKTLEELIQCASDPDIAYTAYRQFIQCDAEMTKKINTLIEHNLRLVAHCVLNQNIKDDDFFDYLHEGVIGFKEALERYNPYRGTQLSTHVVWWINRDIVRALRRKGSTIRLSHSVHDQLKKITMATARAVQEFKCENPTHEQIASILNVDPEIIEEYLQLPYTISLETPLKNDHTQEIQTTLQEHIADPYVNDFTERIETTLYTQQLLNTLTPREQKIVRMYHEYGMTLSEIGAVYGRSRERIRTILREITKKCLEFREKHES